MAIETVAAHWYPRRLAGVQPPELPGSGATQRLAASLLILGIFRFVAVPYLGSCWQPYLGGALFVVPRLLDLVAHRFPTSPRIQALTPQGVVQTVLLLMVGVVLGSLVLGRLAEGRELIRDSFVVLSVPGFALAVMELFGDESPDRARRWYHQLLGLPILVLGVLLAVGVVG